MYKTNYFRHIALSQRKGTGILLGSIRYEAQE